ncbi:hypothetical protein [Clostridium perfringens]|uniref:hypothetical protein n=1 Tax=Clostridium perfringens TaxID=1502 RepID=UPI0039E86BA0
MSFICLPMQGSVIDKDFVGDSIKIIRGSFEDKKKKLMNILNWSENDIQAMMGHLKKTSNEDFFVSPLIIYDDNEEFDVQQYLKYIYNIKYLNNIVDVIYWSNVYPKNKINILEYIFIKKNEINEYRPDMRKINKHFLIADETDYKRFPLNFKYSFDYELDWIQYNKETLEKFLGLSKEYDSLVMKLKNAIEFFYKAILFDSEYKENMFNITLKSDVILFLHTSLECLILKGSNENDKSLSIRKCVKKNIRNFNLNEGYTDMFDFIKYVTNVRGKYVHQGIKYKEKNSKDMLSCNSDKKLTDFEHLKIITAKMIVKCMEIICEIKNSNLSEDDYEEEYFKRLRG